MRPRIGHTFCRVPRTPGPASAHAGGIFFSLDAVGNQGDGRLLIDLVESHYADPPLLRVSVNGHPSEYQLPKGNSDGALAGRSAEGNPYQVVVPVPATQLQPGINRIEIANQGGSYLVFDAIRMEAPVGTRLGRADGVSFTALSGATAIRGLIEKDGRNWQPIDITLRHIGAAAVALLRYGDVTGKAEVLAGDHTVRLLIPEVQQEQAGELEVVLPNENLRARVVVKPVLSANTLRVWAFDLELHSRFKQLRLAVTDAGDGNKADHADWVNVGFLSAPK